MKRGKNMALLALIAAGLFVFTMPSAGFSADNGRVRKLNSNNEQVQDAQKTIAMSTGLLRELQSTGVTIPPELLKNSAGVVVIPSMYKAGLIAGGRYGAGVLMANHKGSWSAPLFVTIGGGSLGAQIGVEKTDLILVFQNQAALEKVISGNNNFTLGADASVLAGSAGTGIGVATQTADIIAYQRTRGLFAGATVNGGVLKVDESKNRAFYDFSKMRDSANAYYPSEQQMVQAVLDVGSNKKPEIRDIPASAQEMRKAMKDYANHSEK